MSDQPWLSELKVNKGANKLGANHHLLPRFYMSFFANAEGKVMTIDRTTNERRSNMSPTKVLTQRNFYTFINEDFEADGSVEELISVIEANACDVLKLLQTIFRRLPLTQQQSQSIYTFMALQMLRGRRMRRTLEIMADFFTKIQITGVTRDNVLEYFKEMGIKPTDLEIQEFFEYQSNLDDIFIAPSTNEHIKFILVSLETWTRRISNRPISIIEFEKPILITSDEPIMTLFGDQYSNVGFLLADEIHFPISPRHLLVLGQAGENDGQFLKCPNGVFNAKEFNREMLRNAHSIAICNPDFEYRGISHIPKLDPLMRVQADPMYIPTNFKENVMHRQPLGKFRNINHFD